MTTKQQKKQMDKLKQIEMHPAKALYSILQWRNLNWLNRRYIRTMNRLAAGPDLIERIALWQWYKALMRVLKEKEYWNADLQRPKTHEEYVKDAAPRVPGVQAWKNLYVDSPAWCRAWNRASVKERVEMTRWAWRVERGLEKHGG